MNSEFQVSPAAAAGELGVRRLDHCNGAVLAGVGRLYCKNCGGLLTPNLELLTSDDPYYRGAARCSTCDYLYFPDMPETWVSEDQRLGVWTRPEDLLDNVHDRESFIAFATALAEERDRAEKIERENPNIYIVDGALGWMNGSIGSFIGAGLTHFEPAFGETPIDVPTWKDLAMFLYRGKIIE